MYNVCFSEDDVTRSMYTVAYDDTEVRSTLTSKVDTVCDAMRVAMQEADPNK